MKLIKKLRTVFITSALFALLIPCTAFAREKISDITLNFSADLEAGDEWPEMEVTSDDEGYLIEGFEFDKDSTGKYPEGTVYLTADDDYYFGTLKKSNCTLEGEGAVFVKAVKKTSQQLRLTVSFHQIGDGEIDEPQALTWSEGGVASWEAVPGARYYQIRLMRDGKSVSTPSTQAETNSYDFASLITEPGTYAYRLRAVSRYNSSTFSEWVTSPPLKVDETSLAFIKSIASTGSQGTASAQDPSAQSETPGQWAAENGEWYWQNPDGSRALSQWIFLNGEWYYVGNDGRMAVGWTWIPGSDGVSRCYYFNAVSDGTKGRMLVSSSTPDGFIVDGTGAWTVDGVVQTR